MIFIFVHLFWGKKYKITEYLLVIFIIDNSPGFCELLIIYVL